MKETAAENVLSCG